LPGLDLPAFDCAAAPGAVVLRSPAELPQATRARLALPSTRSRSGRWRWWPRAAARRWRSGPRG